MLYRRMSCRGKSVTLVRLELERLYEQRSAVEAAIRELEMRRSVGSGLEAPQSHSSLEHSVNGFGESCSVF